MVENLAGYVQRDLLVPVEMVGGATGGSQTYSNTEHRAIDFVRYSLSPWIVRLDTALSKLLPSTLEAKLNPGGLLRADLRSRYEAHKLALEAGFMTINEVREIEDLGPLPASSPPPAPAGNGAGQPSAMEAV